MKSFIRFFPRPNLVAMAFFLAGNISSPVWANISVTERNVLIALYKSTNGNDWRSNANWCAAACPAAGTHDVPTFNATGTECPVSGMPSLGWQGVECDASNTHVTGIILVGNKLTGTLPDLVGLSKLQSFSVGVNRLTGIIPDPMGFTELQYFLLYDNLLTGTIPTLDPAITGLTALKVVNVEQNRLTGEIPKLNGITTLTDFSASENQLTGPLPDIGGLSSLEYFNVSENHLTGKIHALSGLPALNIFDVSTNQLTDGIPSLNEVTALIWFSVSGNHLTGTIPALTQLTELHVFRIGDNQLTGTLPTPPASLDHTIAYSHLCPNSLDVRPNVDPMVDAIWNQATQLTPWWGSTPPGDPTSCEHIFTDGFEG